MKKEIALTSSVKLGKALKLSFLYFIIQIRNLHFPSLPLDQDTCGQPKPLWVITQVNTPNSHIISSKSYI